MAKAAPSDPLKSPRPTRSNIYPNFVNPAGFPSGLALQQSILLVFVLHVTKHFLSIPLSSIQINS